MPASKERYSLFIATARKNPEFATRLLQQLPEDARAEVLSALMRPEPVVATRSLAGPGLRKCPAPRPKVNNGMSAQLNLFAKAVSRVS